MKLFKIKNRKAAQYELTSPIFYMEQYILVTKNEYNNKYCYKFPEILLNSSVISDLWNILLYTVIYANRSAEFYTTYI